MKRGRKTMDGPGELRRRAESRLQAGTSRSRSPAARPGSAEDARRLLQELRVHQVELELQNAALVAARDQAEALMEKYTGLYDFTPVGCFSLDQQGRILEANRTGATLLGMEPAFLLRRGLSAFVAPDERTAFLTFLARVFTKPGTHVCEVQLRTANRALFWTSIQAVAARPDNAGQRWCRVAVSDITSLQQARDAQRRLEVLTVHNQELQQEIARRQIVEEDLRQSELRQGRLLTQSGRMQEELRQLAHDLLHAQEAERQRISRELHDEVIQNLVGITVGLEALARKARLNPERLRHDITGTQQLVESCVNTVHRFALELRPPALDDLGLPTTLRSLIREFRERTGIRVRFTSCAGVEELGCDQRTVLYRIAQSALANIAQHAHAGRVAVTLRPCAGGLRLEIRDDGCSFDVEQVINARTNRRLGLLGMRERAEMIGGHLEIQSAPGRGTTVRATIPAPGTSWKGDT